MTPATVFDPVKWENEYLNFASKIPRIYFKKTDYQVKILDLANHVMSHADYAESKKFEAIISVKLFMKFMEKGNDLSPYLRDHYETLLKINNKVSDQTLWGKLGISGGYLAIAAAIWKIVCQLVLNPLFGITCIEIKTFDVSSSSWLLLFVLGISLIVVSKFSGFRSFNR